ncbi:hypothetical protein LJR066_005716 [Acidovorax sp. LjRoot66]|uniref:hypothetical protein n=1 Tax=Acidovorax sp. LjRoot66 TaxID=3342334 RepID=UPI003ECE11AE
MTSEEMDEFRQRLEQVRNQVDDWFVNHATNSKKGRAASMAMLQSRRLAEDLLAQLHAEAMAGVMLRSAWSMKERGIEPTLH